MLLERYEQALKESFAYLDTCFKDQELLNTLEYLDHLGIDRKYVIIRQMQIRGFDVHAEYLERPDVVVIYPPQHNLPIHIWKRKHS